MPRSAFLTEMTFAIRLPGIAALAAWVACAGCSAAGNAPPPAVAKQTEAPAQRRIIVLTTSESDQKYCNGERMDSDGYRRTLTRETPLSLPRTGSTLGDVRAVLDATTTGMCNTVMKQLDFRVEQGELHVPPIDAWAGVSIVMCHCEPEVELNLSRIPGITRVVWDAASESSTLDR